MQAASKSVKSMFVPAARSINEYDLKAFSMFLNRNESLFCLTGAGISTESGIPDYRSKGVGLYDRENHKPITHQEFTRSAHKRQRYWARNYVGYKYFAIRQPNENHFAIDKLIKRGKIRNLVTQNVDGLHLKAGSHDLVELHGNNHRVVCLDCRRIIARQKLQLLLDEANVNWETPITEETKMAPDADSILTPEEIEGFQVCDCPYCGGILKPDVTFFGDNVNYNLVQSCYESVRNNDACLVVGSSLFVWSGFRFIREAISNGKDVFVINIGETRADAFAKKNNLSSTRYSKCEVQASLLLNNFVNSDIPDHL